MSKEKKKNKKLKKGVYRCIKIGRDALLDYAVEKLLEDQDRLMNTGDHDTSQTFIIDPESGDLLFCAYRSEDKDGEPNRFPDLSDTAAKRLIKAVPYSAYDLTDTDGEDKVYIDYTEEQLMTLQKIGGVRVRKSE